MSQAECMLISCYFGACEQSRSSIITYWPKCSEAMQLRR